MVPKKIVNPLRSGLPSKIYLLAFNGPLSGYKIAQKIYGKKYAPTSKIYPWTKKLEERGFIRKVQEGYVSNVQPLLSEIEGTSTDEKLEFSDLDKYVLNKMVDSKDFRSYVLTTNEKISLRQDIDSVWVISGTLGKLASSILICSAWMGIDFNVESKEDFDKTWENLRRIRKKADFKQIVALVQNEHLRKELDSDETKLIKKEFSFLIDILPFFAVPKDILLGLLRFSHESKMAVLILFILGHLASRKPKPRPKRKREKVYTFSEGRLLELSKKYPKAIKELLEGDEKVEIKD